MFHSQYEFTWGVPASGGRNRVTCGFLSCDRLPFNPLLASLPRCCTCPARPCGATPGQPPMQYLAQWRMEAAAGLLRDSRATVASVAQDVGYDSQAAFARAFKRAVGTSPARWRQQHAHAVR